MKNLCVVLHWMLQPFNLQSSASRYVPSVVVLLYGAKRRWNNSHLIDYPFLVLYALQYLVLPLLKRFGSQMPRSLPVRLRLVPLLGQVFVYQRAIVVLDNLGFSNHTSGRQV